jgi:hypothetical protein
MGEHFEPDNRSIEISLQGKIGYAERDGTDG